MSLRTATDLAEQIPGIGPRLRIKRVMTSLAGLDRTADRARLRDDLSAIGVMPVGHLPSALRIAEAIFRSGVDDDRLEEVMSVLCDLYPDSSELQVLRANHFAYKGLAEQAWRYARRGRLLDPTNLKAAAAVVEYTNRIRPPDEAEALAVTMVRRHPASPAVIAAAASHCVTPQHFRRLYAAWLESGTEPADLIPVVEGLAMAADRSGQTDTALDLYRRALSLHPGKTRPGHTGGAQSSRNRSRLVIEDLDHALGGTALAYFLAEDTLLWLARDDRSADPAADICVGVLDGENAATVLATALANDPRFDPVPAHPRTDTVAARHRSGMTVRLHRYHRDGDRLRRDGAFASWSHTPVSVTRTDFEGMVAPTPTDVDKYLGELYGPWRTVDRDCDPLAGDANLDVTDAEGLRLHQLARAWRHLNEGRRAAAAAGLSAADETGLAELVSAR